MRNTTSQLAATVITMAGVTGAGSSALAGDQLLWWGSNGEAEVESQMWQPPPAWMTPAGFHLHSIGIELQIVPPSNDYTVQSAVGLVEAMVSASTMTINASLCETSALITDSDDGPIVDTKQVADPIPLTTLVADANHQIFVGALPTTILLGATSLHSWDGLEHPQYVTTAQAFAGAVEYAFFIEPVQESAGNTRFVDGSGNVFLGASDIGSSSVDGWGAVRRVSVQSSGSHSLVSSQSGNLLLSSQNEAAFFTVRQSPSVTVAVPTVAQSTLAVLVGPGSALIFQESITGEADLRKDGAGSMAVGAATIAGRVDVIEGTLSISSKLRSSALAIWAQGSEDGVLGDAPVRPVLDLSQASARVIVDYTTADPALLSLDTPMYNPAALVARIKAAYGKGDWSGMPVVPGMTVLDGIFTSSAAAASVGGSDQLGIGYGESATVLGSSGGQFGDEQVDGTAALFMVTLRGDTNLDGQVNFADLLRQQQFYDDPGQWTEGDFDYSGTVTSSDLLALAQNYGGSLLQDGSVLFDLDIADRYFNDLAYARALVPEPTFGATLVVFATLALRRRLR